MVVNNDEVFNPPITENTSGGIPAQLIGTSYTAAEILNLLNGKLNKAVLNAELTDRLAKKDSPLTFEDAKGIFLGSIQEALKPIPTPEKNQGKTIG